MRWTAAILLAAVSLSVIAQDDESTSAGGEPVAPEDSAPAAPVRAPSGEATVNLQTTITGNQEQPRVLYILPWQSPEASDIEFETLSSQYDEVFGHLEREELRRSLEAEAALNKAKP